MWDDDKRHHPSVELRRNSAARDDPRAAPPPPCAAAGRRGRWRQARRDHGGPAGELCAERDSAPRGARGGPHGASQPQPTEEMGGASTTNNRQTAPDGNVPSACSTCALLTPGGVSRKTSCPTRAKAATKRGGRRTQAGRAAPPCRCGAHQWVQRVDPGLLNHEETPTKGQQRWPMVAKAGDVDGPHPPHARSAP